MQTVANVDFAYCYFYSFFNIIYKNYSKIKFKNWGFGVLGFWGFGVMEAVADAYDEVIHL